MINAPNRCIHCGHVIPEDSVTQALTIDHIMKVVAEVTKIPIEEYTRRYRGLENVFAKQIAAYLGYFYTKQDVRIIAKALNYDQHSSITHGMGKIDQDVRLNFDTRRCVNEALNMLEHQGFTIKNYGLRTWTRPDVVARMQASLRNYNKQNTNEI